MQHSAVQELNAAFNQPFLSDFYSLIQVALTWNTRDVWVRPTAHNWLRLSALRLTTRQTHVSLNVVNAITSTQAWHWTR